MSKGSMHPLHSFHQLIIISSILQVIHQDDRLLEFLLFHDVVLDLDVVVSGASIDQVCLLTIDLHNIVFSVYLDLCPFHCSFAQETWDVRCYYLCFQEDVLSVDGEWNVDIPEALEEVS